MSKQTITRVSSSGPSLERKQRSSGKQTGERQAAALGLPAKVAGVTRKVKFGSVVVSGAHPDKTMVSRAIEQGFEALERVSRKLMKPGVSIRAKKGVPHYAIDEGEPGVFVRRLDGRTQRGRLINGVFTVID